MMTLPADEYSLAQAAAAILREEIVVVPTETVYGIVADAASEKAIARIYALKIRERSVPLQVLAPDLAAAEALGLFNETARMLAAAFCPGPLTLVVPRREDAPLAPALSAGLATIGIRIPDHPFVQSLLRRVGGTLAASSANRSGEPSPATAEEAARGLGPDAALVIDGGRAAFGLASTVVDCTAGAPLILRAGNIAAEKIRAVLDGA